MRQEVQRAPGTFLPLLKLALFTVFVPGTVTLWLPYSLYTAVFRAGMAPGGSPRRGGAVVILAGTIGYFWCALDFAFADRGTPAPFDPPKALVARGLYRYVRNPMYLSVLLVLLGESLLFKSLLLLRYAALWWFIVFLFVLFYEEPALRRKFGSSYESYCAGVPRWIPRLPRAKDGHAV